MVYKKSWKYILIKDDILKNCYRPKAVKDFSNVSKGEIGGIVAGYHNLSHKGKCWVYDDANVSGNARISENAKVCSGARVFEGTIICGNARIKDRVLAGGTYRR